MSHFTSLKTQLCSQEALVVGLYQLFTQNDLRIPIESYGDPVLLENAYDPSDRSSAHVLIRRQHLDWDDRESLIDIGFLRNDVGTFDMVADSWDFNKNLGGKIFGNLKSFINQVQMAHDHARVEQQFPPHLWDYEKVDLPDGGITLTLTERRPDLTLSGW